MDQNFIDQLKDIRDRMEFEPPLVDATLRHWIDSAPSNANCEEILRDFLRRSIADVPMPILQEFGEIILRELVKDSQLTG